MTMTANYKRERQATRVKLAAMLTENTGRSFLDSGDYYGRNWQQNQGRDFESQPVSYLRADVRQRDGVNELDMVGTLDVYHWLADRLTFNPYRQRCFEKWQQRTGNDGGLQSAEEYVASLPNAAGIYGDGEPLTVNTYNGEDCLSQVLQYVFWTDDDGEHVLLQIHGGCDVRGGYTDAVWFDVNSELAILDNARCTLACPRGCVSWDSDDGGYSFHNNGDSQDDFKSLDVVTERPDYQSFDPAQRVFDGFEKPHHAPSTGALYVCEETHKPHCPCCGEVLELWS